MERIITIFEISQKQAFIFSSNKLKDNIQNSDIIARITSSEYIEETVGNSSLYSENANLVYAGGGHTIMEFPSEDDAREVVARLTRCILEEYPNIEMFAKSIPYDETLLPSENIQKLIDSLEEKKSLRLASFHQRSFGIEGDRIRADQADACERSEWVPEGYAATKKLEDLGGGDSNFVAVVHIDGNAMGKRVSDISETEDMKDWNTYKTKMKAFSKAIDSDFKAAYKEMCTVVAKSMLDEKFADKVSLKINSNEKSHIFPIRRIISEGDDICFVANGQLGIECAAAFIKALTSKTNAVDHKKYAACAGVAIVHQKYPFYRAYELAEELCSSAKKYGAGLSADGTGGEISCIDWHIEYGELQDTLEETRKQYITDDGGRMELRPYIVAAPEEIIQADKFRRYEIFRKLMRSLEKGEESYGRGFIKNMRPAIKKGQKALDYYIQFHQADSIKRDAYQGIYTEVDYASVKLDGGVGLERRSFIETKDGKNRSIFFDAIEIMDSFIMLREESL